MLRRWRKLIIGLAVAAAVLVFAGCGGGEGAATATETETTAAEPTTETTTTLSTSGAEKPAADWTEFGATEEAWKSAHEPDTRYAEGCCYLSGPLSAEGRYAGINTDDYKGVSRVDSFELFFDPPVSVALAREVVRAEAPPQSRLVFAIKKGDCLLINYRSPALTRAFGSKSAVMSAGLYSSAGGPFNGRTVDDIIFLPVGGRSLGC